MAFYGARSCSVKCHIRFSAQSQRDESFIAASLLLTLLLQGSSVCSVKYHIRFSAQYRRDETFIAAAGLERGAQW